MASIFIYNRARGKCVELSTPNIFDEDIATLRASLPPNLEGISFDAPVNAPEDTPIPEVHLEERELRVAEYLKSIGTKLAQLQQVPGALRFYDLAFRLTKNTEILMMKARVLSQHGQVDQAQKLLNYYIQQHPDSPEAFYMTGKLALSRADYAEAQRNFIEAGQRVRPQNVEHKPLEEILAVYERFVSIYLDRDQLFTRDLPPEECAREIRSLRERTQNLIQLISMDPKAELQGMLFFLETQDRIFEKWLSEMGVEA